MKFSRNNLTMVFGASLSIILGSLSAQPWDNGGYQDGGFPGGYAPQGGYAQGGSDWAGDCCQRPVTCGCGDFFFRVDYLFWQYCAGEIDFADVVTRTNNPATFSQTISQNNGHVGHDTGSGFRLGVGYKNPDCCWDVCLDWTYFHPDRNRHSVTTPVGSVVSFGVPDVFSTTSLFSGFRGSYKLKMDYVDLGFGRELNWGRCIAFRPYVGLRYANITHHLDIDAFGSFVGSATSAFEGRSHERNRFWGIGPRAGLDASWNIGCGWGLYGGSAISLLYGQNKDRLSFSYDDTLGRTASESFRSHNGYCSKFVADVELGLYWKHSFCDDQYPFIARVGWEQHLWLNQSRFVSTVFPSRNDLTTQGLNLSAIIGF